MQSGFRRCIAAEQPDLVLSVHPILQCIPLANFMPENPPRPIPFLTCVTVAELGGVLLRFATCTALRISSLSRGGCRVVVEVMSLCAGKTERNRQRELPGMKAA